MTKMTELNAEEKRLLLVDSGGFNECVLRTVVLYRKRTGAGLRESFAYCRMLKAKAEMDEIGRE